MKIFDKGADPREPGKSASTNESKGDTSPLNEWLARNRSLVLRQTPAWAQSLAGIVIGLGIITVGASIVFRIDEVITVPGQLESLYGTTEVKTPVGGKISKVYFGDGVTVKKGQLLVKFDTRQASEEKKTIENLLKIEINDLESKLKLYKSRREVIENKYKTAKQISEEVSQLVEEGGFRRIEYLERMDQLYGLKSQLSDIDLETSRAKLESSKNIGQLNNRLNNIKLQLQYQNVVAPTDGVIFNSQAQAQGVIQAGETIMTLVPQNGLKARILVSNKDIGFVKTGQSAQIRVDAFPFTRYGELTGSVAQIGADALPPDSTTTNKYAFPVVLSLNSSVLENKGVKIPLRSGMSVTANLRLRDKRLISLVSDMLVDQSDSVRSIRQQ